jgi:putative Mn2+ efflux pump MntP
MIKESFETDGLLDSDILNTRRLILLAIATSIDALLVGITLGVLNLPLLLSVIVIGMVTFILCFFGFLFGKQLGTLFGRRVEIFGGIVLIFIGCKILFEHIN